MSIKFEIVWIFNSYESSPHYMVYLFIILNNIHICRGSEVMNATQNFRNKTGRDSF